MMFSVLGTLGLLVAVTAFLVEFARRDGAKIIAALEGRSWAAEPNTVRPVTIRFSRPHGAAARIRASSGLRAAA